MAVSFAEYEQISLEDPDTKWELVCGQLRQKPPMTTEHDDISRNLIHALALQVPWADYSVDKEGPKLGVPSGNYRIPDVCVIPRALIQERKATLPRRLEVYQQPMPLVVEVWSPSTGGKDEDDKLQEYRERGDLEIWRVHPYERTLIAWVRRPDGGYDESLYREGAVRPAFLPGVEVSLSDLFQ
jgi:Uma2 family endonuclease